MSEASVLQARLVGALFVERGLLTDEQLDRALELQAETGVLLGEILVTEFGISRIELASVLAEQWAELEQTDATESEADDSDQPGQSERPRGTAASRRRIGEIFVERGFVDAAELDEALKAQKESGQPLGEVLIDRGTLSRMDLASALAEQWAGLEKLRPPAPKRVEGWQQVAPVEHAAAAAQGTKRASDAQSPEPALDAALAEAVTELSERLAAVEANGASDPSAGTLAASVDALAARLDRLEAGAGDLRQKADADEIGALRDALSELRERLSEPEARLGLVEGRLNELETDRSTIDGVRSRLAALEKRIAEQASRDDLESIGGDLSNRLEGIDERLDVAVEGARSGLDAVLETLAGVQKRIDAVEAAPAVGEHEHAEITALEARLEEVAGTSTVPDALVERVDALEAAGSAAPWRDELAGLQARLDELAAAGSAATDLAGRLEAIESAAAATPWRVEMTALQGQLAELAAGATSEGLAARLAAVEAATPWRDEVAALQERLEQLASSGGAVDHLAERLATLEAAAAATPWRDEIASLQPRVDELASSMAAAADGLGERLAAIEAASLAAPRREEIAALQTRLQELAESGAPVDDLVERLTALEGHEPDAGWREEIASLRERLAEVSASQSVADGLVARVGTLEAEAASMAWRDQVSALQARLDELGVAASATEGLADRLASLEATSLERPWRTELSRLADELGARLDTLDERLGATTTGPGLDEVQAAVQRLELRLDATASADHAHEEIAGLQARFAELAAARPPDELADRLSALEAGTRERPWQAELRRLAQEVGGRLDGLAGRLDVTDADREQLEQLRAAVEALHERQEQTARADHDHAEFAALEARLAKLAAGSAVDDLAERVSAVEASSAATPWRAEVAALAVRLDDLGTELARVPHDEVAALRIELDTLRDAAGNAERGAGARLADLSKRLDDVARATAELQVAAEETGASAVDRSELERVEGLVAEIAAVARGAARTAEDATTRSDELATATEAARESLDAELRRRIDSAAKKLRNDLGAVDSRVDALTESVAAVAQGAVAPEQVDEAIAAQETRLAERLVAYDEAIVLLRRRLEEIAALDGVLGERMRTIEGGLSVRLDESAAVLTAKAASAQEALDALGERLAGVEQHVSATPGAMHMLHSELSTLATRLEAVETAAVADAGWHEALANLGSRLGELEQRLETEAAQADERTKVTERALRKGLATLGERLAESETAYTEAGNALRRSIERLGRAIVETDAHLAAADEPRTQVNPSAGAYVAFAPTPDGYRLIVIDGRMPEVGHTVELDGHDAPLLVTRVGASPIPLDDRPCAYLERSAPAPQ